MTSRFSAYLSIYNDWDILPSALRSVASHVDELVVVDGAYDWMVPYLTLLGRDPERSDPRVYAAIEASGIPFRVVSRTWTNEIEKRQCGYEACAHDYIYRIDADEVLFFDDSALERALSQGLAVGEMYMPNYVAPGWISRAANLPDIERQCFLFDRRRVSSQIHLNYLWLILTADTLPLAGAKPLPVYPQALAFNAHLTGWRTPETGVNRAAFYQLNWMRKNGVPWLPSLRDRPLANVRALFDLVAPDVFLGSLRRGRIAQGMIEERSGRTIVPTPLSEDQEDAFIAHFDRFLFSLAALNVQAAGEEQPFLTSFPAVLDLSSRAARDAIVRNGGVSLKISAPLVSAKARLLTYATSAPWNEERDLPVQVNGMEMRVELPAEPPAGGRALRQSLEFEVWPDSPDLAHRFRALV